MDVFYKSVYGVPRSQMNTAFLQGLPIHNLLEVGCNVGNQLRLLQKQGYAHLYGIEILDYAVEKAKQLTKGINIIKSSALTLPFKDSYFDCVFTSGVLIHIHPNNLEKILNEIYRVSKRYIWGFEYFNETYIPIEYRGNTEKLWKAPFVDIYLETFPDITVVKAEKYPYTNNASNTDMMFLLEKRSFSIV